MAFVLITIRGIIMKSDPIEMSADMAVAYISANSISMSQMLSLIESMHAAFTGFADRGPGSVAFVDVPIPATSIQP
jgi:predicted transcriptional regulator